MKHVITTAGIFLTLAAAGLAQNFQPNPAAAAGSVNTGYDRTPASITQSTDTATITALNSVACPIDDDAYLRRFDLTTFGITDPFTVQSVDFGVESAVGASTTVNLYTIPTGAPLLLANLTSIGTSGSVAIPDATLAMQNIAVGGTVADPTTTDLVVEVFAADTTNAFTFFIGSNANGESAPNYLLSAGCGASEPTTTAALLFPNMHLVMIVNGDVDDASLLEVPTLGAFGIAGLVGLLALLGLVAMRRLS